LNNIKTLSDFFLKEVHTCKNIFYLQRLNPEQTLAAIIHTSSKCVWWLLSGFPHRSEYFIMKEKKVYSCKTFLKVNSRKKKIFLFCFKIFLIIAQSNFLNVSMN